MGFRNWSVESRVYGLFKKLFVNENGQLLLEIDLLYVTHVLKCWKMFTIVVSGIKFIGIKIKNGYEN